MSSAFPSVKDLFAKRFEQNGDAYLFRRDLSAPACKVSAIERDQFVKQFGQRVWVVNLGLPVLLFVELAVGLWFYLGRGMEVPAAAVYVSVGLLMILYVSVVMWFFEAPVRQFAGRPIVSQGLAKPEARLAGLRSLSWQQLSLCVVLALFMMIRGYGRDPTFSGESRFWFALGGVLIIIACIQSVRKWLAK